jgi:hypothetical protein
LLKEIMARCALDHDDDNLSHDHDEEEAAGRVERVILVVVLMALYAIVGAESSIVCVLF